VDTEFWWRNILQNGHLKDGEGGGDNIKKDLQL
jgi:hypothetical protein